MKRNDLIEILNMSNSATQGPWKSYIEGRDHESGSSFIMTGKEDNRDYDIEFVNIKESDQDLIAIARNILPELVEEIMRLQKLLENNSISY